MAKATAGESTSKSGIVYVFSNPAMPGIVKIGMTTREQVDDRLRELYTTSVPVPFEIEYACKVEDCAKVEDALHIAFGPNRINPQREFFKIEPEQAIAILALFSKDNISAEISKLAEKDFSSADKVAGEKLKQQRRPHLNFIEMGMAVGSEIEFVGRDPIVKATIVSERKVSYENVEYSLTKLTSDLLGLPYQVQPSSYWTFSGRKLSELYEETYGV